MVPADAEDVRQVAVQETPCLQAARGLIAMDLGGNLRQVRQAERQGGEQDRQDEPIGDYRVGCNRRAGTVAGLSRTAMPAVTSRSPANQSPNATSWALVAARA